MIFYVLFLQVYHVYVVILSFKVVPSNNEDKIPSLIHPFTAKEESKLTLLVDVIHIGIMLPFPDNITKNTFILV